MYASEIGPVLHAPGRKVESAVRTENRTPHGRATREWISRSAKSATSSSEGREDTGRIVPDIVYDTKHQQRWLIEELRTQTQEHIEERSSEDRKFTTKFIAISGNGHCTHRLSVRALCRS